MVGGMLKEFGCVNIADSESGLLSELSMEAIVTENPDYIFIDLNGDISYCYYPFYQKNFMEELKQLLVRKTVREKD